MIQIDFSNIKKGKGEKEDECLSKLTAVVDNIEKKAAELDKTNNERNEEFINKCEDLRIYLNSYVEEQKECPKEEFSRVYGIIESVIKESLKKYNNYRKCPSELKEIIKEQIKLGHEIDELFKECKHCENKITKSEEEVPLKKKNDGELGVERLGADPQLNSASLDKQEPAREEDNSESSQHSQPVNEEKITASGESRDKHTAHDSLETEGVQHSDSSPEDPKRVSVSESDPTESLQGSCSNNPVLCDKLDRRALENNQVSVTDPSVSVSSSSESCTISSLQCALNIPVSTPVVHQATDHDQTPKVHAIAPANISSTVTTSTLTAPTTTTTTSTVTSTASSTTPVITHTRTPPDGTLSVSTPHSGTLHTIFSSSKVIHKIKTSAELLPVAKQSTTGEPLQSISGVSSTGHISSSTQRTCSEEASSCGEDERFKTNGVHENHLRSEHIEGGQTQVQLEGGLQVEGDTSISIHPHVTTLNGILVPNVGENLGENSTENANTELSPLPPVLTKLSNKKYLIIILALSSIILLLGPIIKYTSSWRKSKKKKTKKKSKEKQEVELSPEQFEPSEFENNYIYFTYSPQEYS